MSVKKSWRWFWDSKENEWQLLDERGRQRATVWMSGTWHTWDVNGIGGENAHESNVDEAKAQATAAVIRQGWAHIVSVPVKRRKRR